MRNCTFISALACALFASSLAAPFCSAAQPQEAGDRVLIHGRAPLRETVGRDGHRVSLREALAATAPRAYSINLPNAGAWADTPVSWHGHRAFAQVLKEILADHPDLSADVDTDLRLVTITKRATSFESPRMGEATPAAASASAAELIAQQPHVLAWSGGEAASAVRRADTSKATREPVEATVAAPKAEVRPTLQAAQTQPVQLPVSEAATVARTASPSERAWNITPADRTIKGALARWAREAGWQFVWDVPTDFAVDASATINGTLEDALNAVAQALKRSQVPIQVILYEGNKVIRVVGEGAA